MHKNMVFTPDLIVFGRQSFKIPPRLLIWNNSKIQNGAFVVRPSSADLNKPYVLVVYVDGEIKNIRIRKRSDSMFALGEGKPNEKVSLKMFWHLKIK